MSYIHARRSRLQALSVLVCAFIMSFASIEVIQFSIVDIVSGLNCKLPVLNVSVTLYAIFSVGALLKLAMFIYCRYVNVVLKSDMLEALAKDHFNDVPIVAHTSPPDFIIKVHEGGDG